MQPIKPIKKNYDQLAGQKIQRIEALSDGVFAIALTILVLDLRVPLSVGRMTETKLLEIFISLTPKLLSYFLSFMTLGILWTGHTAQFQYIEKSDRHLNWITLFFLLFISILPFTTAFLSEYIKFRFSVFIYWLNILLPGLLLLTHWEYAWKHQFMKLDMVDAANIYKIIKYRIITSQSLYAFGAVLCMFNTYLSITFIILIQLNYALAFFSQIQPEVRAGIHEKK